MIEVLIASGIFALIAASLLSAMSYFYKGQRRVRQMTAEDRQVASLINNIRANLSQYQSSFAPVGTEAANKTVSEMKHKLPIAFSDQAFTSVDKCPTCPGRMGFVLQPLAGMPSLYKITMWVTHSELYGKDAQGTPAIKEFRFVASFK